MLCNNETRLINSKPSSGYDCMEMSLLTSCVQFCSKSCCCSEACTSDNGASCESKKH